MISARRCFARNDRINAIPKRRRRQAPQCNRPSEPISLTIALTTISGKTMGDRTMGGTLRRARWYSGAAASAFILFIGANGTANAQAASEAQVKALQAQVEALMRTVKELKEAQSHTAADVKAAKKQATQAEANSALAKATAADAHKRAKQPGQEPDGSTRTATISSSASRARASRSIRRAARSPATANSTFRSTRRRRTPKAPRSLRTAPRRSAISAGCPTSRPIFPIWACAASSASPRKRSTSSISSKPASTFRRRPAPSSRTATSATRSTARYSAATATSDLPQRIGEPSRSARPTRPTRTRPRCSIHSPACGATMP